MRNKVLKIFSSFLLVVFTIAAPAGEKSTLKSTLREHATEARDCFRVTLGDKTTASQKIVVHWVLDETGKVIGPAVNEKKSSLLSKDIENCLINLVKTIHFPKPPAGHAITVSYPFTFNPKTPPIEEQESSEPAAPPSESP